MYIIGERINGMFKAVRQAIEEKDAKAIQELAMNQIKGGAQALDLNVGPANVDQVEAMQWLADTVREVSDVALSVDSPKWTTIQAVIPRITGKKIINSCKASEEELSRYLDLAVAHNAGLVALTIDQKGVPADVDRRVELGAQIITKATEKGLPMENLFVDPIILPVNVAPAQPGHVLCALQQLVMFSDPKPHLLLGLSNLSQNCTNRKLINRTYLVMTMAAGLSAVILDPLDTELTDAVITAELLLGKAIYCDSFLDAYRMRSQLAKA